MSAQRLINVLFQMILLLVPWAIRRIILCSVFNYEIDRTARIRCAVIFAKRLKMGPKSRIGNFVICKPIDQLVMGEDAAIGALTYITGISNPHPYYYRHMKSRKCELILEKGACITGRHYVDCSCGIYVGAFTTIAGLRSQLMTHSLDVYHCRQGGAPITIGKYCFIGTQCILLPGATIPEYSILGAGSLVNKSLPDAKRLYAGVPAVERKVLDVEHIPWMSRTNSNAEYLDHNT